METLKSVQGINSMKVSIERCVNAMKVEEVEELVIELQQCISNKHNAKRNRLIEKWQEEAIDAGYGNMKEVVSGTKEKIIRYQDPTNSANTWSGRGRKPCWLVDQEGSGRSKDEFLIN